MSRIDRRSFMRQAGSAAVAGSLLGLTESQAEGAKKPRAPNLLFILADQWRFSAFGHGSDPMVRTPNFDRLASEGALWQRAYAANPVCSPNRSAVVTGRFPHQTGMIKNSLMLPPTERCIGHVFGQAGYATHYIGKWHMDGQDKPGYVPPGWRRRGFQTFVGFNRGHAYTKSPTFSTTGEPMKPRGYEPTFQTDQAIDFMKRHKDGPFFCYLSWGPPHMPYRPPKRFDRFSPDHLEWRRNVSDRCRQNVKIRRQLAGYYGLCESLDHELGRILAALKAMDLDDNTLIAFTSDHGDMHGSHGKQYKGHPEEESLHVPLFMRLPGAIKAGQKTQTLVSTVDLMPTIVSLCGLKVPSTCTGRDLSAVITGGRSPAVESVYAEGRMQLGKAWRAVVTPQHKLAMDIAGRVTHLFDLQADPYEMKNLAEDRSREALRKDLVARLRRWGKETGDTFPKTPAAAKVMYT